MVVSGLETTASATSGSPRRKFNSRNPIMIRVRRASVVGIPLHLSEVNTTCRVMADEVLTVGLAGQHALSELSEDALPSAH